MASKHIRVMKVTRICSKPRLSFRNDAKTPIKIAAPEDHAINNTGTAIRTVSMIAIARDDLVSILITPAGLILKAHRVTPFLWGIYDLRPFPSRTFLRIKIMIQSFETCSE
ncbi:hypothetical protein O5O45_09835 [Hahella aquimaris]|uniref:hypothetical protein n=1 Tax=Hahella sp. HNIBRBA332 TaxID=3015983 RepID=UPI00273C7DD8|nr:hypothetical protein [Hahella sp. HNIBRBA332]WLQ16214.1 hypothetical protein O5O45_09835 [Hahella sp. HNIBRBA332]